MRASTAAATVLLLVSGVLAPARAAQVRDVVTVKGVRGRTVRLPGVRPVLWKSRVG